jgi:glutathionylspermidine synthase
MAIHKIQLMKFFAKHYKMSDALKSIKAELYEAKKAFHDDFLPVARPELIDGTTLTDDQFMAEYSSTIKDSFPDELSEAVIKIIDLADAFDYNIFDYVSMHQRYCKIKQASDTVVSKTTPVSATKYRIV